MRLMATSRESTRPADLLVERARRRDHSAFEDLYWEHHRRVYALMLRMACDPGRAEELTQDVFVQAWKGLPKFRGDSSFGTWLHALAVRTFLNADRRDRRIHDREVSGDALDRYVFAAKQAMPETAVPSGVCRCMTHLASSRASWIALWIVNPAGLTIASDSSKDVPGRLTTEIVSVPSWNSGRKPLPTVGSARTTVDPTSSVSAPYHSSTARLGRSVHRSSTRP